MTPADLWLTCTYSAGGGGGGGGRRFIDELPRGPEEHSTMYRSVIVPSSVADGARSHFKVEDDQHRRVNMSSSKGLRWSSRVFALGGELNALGRRPHVECARSAVSSAEDPFNDGNFTLDCLIQLGDGVRGRYWPAPPTPPRSRRPDPQDDIISFYLIA